MTPADHLLALVDKGHDLMARERSLLLSGEFAGLARLSAEKHGLLVSLEEAMGRVRGTRQVRAAIAALIDDSRRNERIILAARQGIGAARRRIETIIATGRGAVAYDRDGAAITSRDDAAQKNSRA
ncbi:MAG: hypothetical protein ACE5EU_15740 [Paracoccaceae bacterium]